MEPAAHSLRRGPGLDPRGRPARPRARSGEDPRLLRLAALRATWARPAATRALRRRGRTRRIHGVGTHGDAAGCAALFCARLHRGGTVVARAARRRRLADGKDAPGPVAPGCAVLYAR